MPSDLCRWYIHTRSQSYEGIEEDEFEPSDFDQPDLDQPDLDQPDPDQFDFDDDATWPSWSLDEQQTSLHAHLRNALEHNEFSTTPTTDLPVAIPELAKAADEERSNELLLESLGRDDEDLFGILACAVCLIFHGFDPSVRADISVAALLSLDSFVECDHVELTAAELAEEIMAMPAFGLWDIKIKTGWVVLTGILHRCEAAHVKRLGKRVYLSESSCDSDPVPFAEPDEDTRFMGYTKPDMYLTVRHKHIQSRSHCFIEQKDLGALWSSVQAEFLSYRRLNDGLGWTSQYFSMETLREQLNGGKDLAVGYTEHNLLKAHCSCHSFGRYAPTMLSDAVDPGLANLNGLQGRASYGGEPELQ
ncbi:unnamed protein product [Alternaria alternata]